MSTVRELVAFYERVKGLLIESYHVVSSDPSPVGRFYRSGRHGLASRLADTLKELGVSVTEPANRPASQQTQGQRPRSLSLVPSGAEHHSDEADYTPDAPGGSV